MISQETNDLRVQVISQETELIKSTICQPGDRIDRIQVISQETIDKEYE